jgi:hypothetical protein
MGKFSFMEGATTIASKAELEKEFNALAAEWRRDTALLSIAQQKAMHPAYQKIIGMGREALPLIFKEIKVRGGDWLWALEMIVRNENPAAGVTKFKDAVDAWVNWGRKRGVA